jgi:hypothetical protein
MTYTGRLINEDAQVSMEDGPILAVRGPNPIATAAGKFAKWGQTQPVTVTGDPGTVDNIAVVFVTSIQWATHASAAPADDLSQGGVASLDDAVAPPVTTAPQTITTKKSATKKTPRKGK